MLVAATYCSEDCQPASRISFDAVEAQLLALIVMIFVLRPAQSITSHVLVTSAYERPIFPSRPCRSPGWEGVAIDLSRFRHRTPINSDDSPFGRRRDDMRCEELSMLRFVAHGSK